MRNSSKLFLFFMIIAVFTNLLGSKNDIAKKIEGSIRNTSIHAAGIIVCADPITDHVPISIAKDSDMFVTQFSMKPVEAVGMLKIDFLGLKRSFSSFTYT